ncbi:MAG: RraA family protein, partial [Chloroflexi bacterium]
MKMSQDERQALLDLFKDLRVADVRDGMDWN